MPSSDIPKKNKILDVLKTHSFPLVLIVLGSLVLYWIKDYKKVPSGIGPDFFPRIVAIMLIGFSLIVMFLQRGKENTGEFKPIQGSTSRIAVVVVLLIVSTQLMGTVHVALGIFVFLLGYLKFIAKQKLALAIITSVIGAVALYAVVVLLRIPM